MHVDARGHCVSCVRSRPPHFASHVRCTAPTSSVGRALTTGGGWLGLRGKDARTFLQNLCSNDVSLLANPHDAMFTCWLTPKGRAVCEAHVSLLTNSVREDAMRFGLGSRLLSCCAQDDPGGESFLLDLDPACLKDAVAHAARYKLRSDVAFHDLSRVVSAFALLPEAAEVAATQPGSDSVSAEATALLDKARAHIQPHGGTIFADPRASGMGLRAHVPHNFNCMPPSGKLAPRLVLPDCCSVVCSCSRQGRCNTSRGWCVRLPSCSKRLP